MDYEACSKLLEERMKVRGINLGLKRVKALVELLGNPQDRVKCIHIAGTNGKGSVLRMVSAVLTRAGYRTGTYSSPAVFRTWEKIAINGQDIAEADVAKYLSRVLEAEDELGRVHPDYGLPTAFELETLLAYCYFAGEKCDYMVVEVGLGGDEDATNIITDQGQLLAAVITSISLDHTRILGNTLAEIAGHKAGITRPGVPIITTEGQEQEVLDVLQKKAEAQGADLILAETSPVLTGMPASYQRQNAAIAYAALQQVIGQLPTEEQSRIDDGFIRQVWQNLTWPGRFEQVSTRPAIFLDGAHNPAAAKQLSKTIREQFPGRRCIFVMGVMADKNHEEILRTMLPLATALITVQPDNPRAMTAEDLAAEAEAVRDRLQQEAGLSAKWSEPDVYDYLQIIAAESIAEGIGLALKEAAEYQTQKKVTGQQVPKDSLDGQLPEPPIICFGSLYYLGTAKRILAQYQNVSALP